jgi:hypothetical protein
MSRRYLRYKCESNFPSCPTAEDKRREILPWMGDNKYVRIMIIIIIIITVNIISY